MPSLPTITNILRSPGFLTWNGGTLLSEADIEVNFVQEWRGVDTSTHGVIEERPTNRRIEVSATPTRWTQLATWFPYADKAIGSRIRPAADLPIVITPLDGAPLTIAAGVMFSPAEVHMRSDGPAFSSAMQLRGLCAGAADPALEASYFSFGTAGEGTMPSITHSEIPNGLYELAFGDTTGILSSNGFRFRPAYEMESVTWDSLEVDYRLRRVSANFAFSPFGKSEADFASLIGFSGGIGQSPTKKDATLTGPGIDRILLRDAVARQAQAAYGQANRTGEIELFGNRSFADGSLEALWDFVTPAP